MFHLGSLDGDGLIHHGGEVGKVMDDKSKLEVRVEATVELLLLASISSDLFFCFVISLFRFMITLNFRGSR